MEGEADKGLPVHLTGAAAEAGAPAGEGEILSGEQGPGLQHARDRQHALGQGQDGHAGA